MNPKVKKTGRHWSNADEDRIEIVKHDPEWPGKFSAECRLLKSVLPRDLNYSIIHFGSTSIPQMAAKPVIDIMIICKDQAQWNQFISPLESLNYIYWKDNQRKDRMFFVKGMPPYGKKRTHHVHVRTPEDSRAALLFRDYLKAHPSEARKYEQLKLQMMKNHKTDRDAYTEAKGEYTERIVARAEIWKTK